MSLIIRLLITAIVAYALSMLLDPHVVIDNFGSALVFALVLGLLNILVKPILIILTLPVTILTLGLFLLVLNVLMIIITDKLLDGVHINGFWWTCLFGILLSFLSSVLLSFDKKSK